MELSQEIRTQKTLQLRQILQMFFLFSLHACFSCGMIFTLQYCMAVSPMSASTARKTLTDDQQTPSTYKQILQDLIMIQNTLRLEKIIHTLWKRKNIVKLPLFCQNQTKNENASIFSLNGIIFSVPGPKLNANSLFQELMLSLRCIFYNSGTLTSKKRYQQQEQKWMCENLFLFCKSCN